LTAGKVRSWDGAQIWRASIHGSLVFTNGVFDILHPGHIELLTQARQLGVALLVALNDDHSARLLGKGPGRPVNPQDDRAAVVSALAVVDCVVFFPEETPAALIQALRPDILVKGADYALDDIPGRSFVESIGGRVVRLPLKEGYSTTAIVERIRGES
jgi:D-glycero-beta-D-manno-heptose 1-phosphate adenylyltransferase